MKAPMGFFVTGTDTEVGKTLVAAAIILKLQEQGTKAVGFKPVAAGTYIDFEGKKRNEDVETLRLISGADLEDSALCPYILDQPAAPHVVAKMNGVELDCAVMLNDLRALQERFDAVVVEGAGGFLVPLNADEDLGDLAQAIDLPIILVIGMRLGCINHALLTCEAIQSRQLPIAGWIANTLTEEMPFLEDNLQTLNNRIFAPCLGVIPSIPMKLAKAVNSPYSKEAIIFAAQHLKLPSQFG